MASLAIRIASAVVLAGATLSAGAIGNPPAATAAPEWDVGAYDACMKNESEMVDVVPGYPVGSNTIKYCCDISGGVYNPDGGTLGTCGAPPAIAADTPDAPPQEAANPDVPAAPPPPKPGPKPATPRIPSTPTTTTAAPVG